MKLVDPVVRPTKVPVDLAPRLDSLEGKTVGLWSNQKLNAGELLACVEAELRSRHRIAAVDLPPLARPHDPGRGVGAVHDPGDAVILTHGD